MLGEVDEGAEYETVDGSEVDISENEEASNLSMKNLFQLLLYPTSRSFFSTNTAPAKSHQEVQLT